jgi:hypothetical protein
MSRTVPIPGRAAAVAVVLAAAAIICAPGALASPAGPARIRPHQYFAGVVNGKLDNAVVKVACPGPASFGRALPGQTVAVTSPSVIASNTGYTGSRGRSIAADVPGSSSAVTLLFKQYNQPAEFPTGIDLPCGGTGQLIFTPVPGSASARSATVTVTYENVAVTAP